VEQTGIKIDGRHQANVMETVARSIQEILMSGADQATLQAALGTLSDAIKGAGIRDIYITNNSVSMEPPKPVRGKR